VAEAVLDRITGIDFESTPPCELAMGFPRSRCGKPSEFRVRFLFPCHTVTGFYCGDCLELTRKAPYVRCRYCQAKVREFTWRNL
jgi:hypothetical protein